jgi:hypothetical protein
MNKSSEFQELGKYHSDEDISDSEEEPVAKKTKVFKNWDSI